MTKVKYDKNPFLLCVSPMKPTRKTSVKKSETNKDAINTAEIIKTKNSVDSRLIFYLRK